VDQLLLEARLGGGFRVVSRPQGRFTEYFAQFRKLSQARARSR
jgi:hypothetical protein